MFAVEVVEDATAATWDALLAASPGGGHALQSFAWGTFKATQGWLPHRLALQQDGRVVGAAQLLVRRLPGSDLAIAYCPKGPWIDWANPEQVHVMLGGMEQVARRQGAIVLKVESELQAGPGQPVTPPSRLPTPFQQLGRALRAWRHGGQAGPRWHRAHGQDGRVAAARAALVAAREAQAADGHTPARQVFRDRGYRKARWDPQFRTTMLVDLDRPAAALLARMHPKWRYNIQLAQRRGVTIVQDGSPAARAVLYDLYRETTRRQGIGERPAAYLAGVWETMLAAGNADLFLAYHDGRPLAGLLAFTFGQKVWYQLGASASEGRAVMPAHALQFHVMQWAQQRGMRTYDLVAIPNLEMLSSQDPMWGLYVFKSGFGGHPVEWIGCLDKVLDPRGHLWEAIEPLYYRLYRWRRHDVLY